MEAAIFIFYLVLISYLLIKIPFLKNAGLSNKSLIGLFLIKVSAGIAYAKFYQLPKYYQGSDTWRFFRLSLAETKWLLHDPVAFTKDLFLYGYKTSGNVFISQNTYWNDLKSNVPVKIMAVMNVFTRSSYYTNIILFNFLFLFGIIALFRIFVAVYPQKKIFIIIGLFLLPSTLFWCSGIHKDGLILSALGLLIYSFYKGFTGIFTPKRIACIILNALLIFSLRNYVIFALIPALFAWGISKKIFIKIPLVFGGIYAVSIALFFLLPHIFPSFDLPLYFSLRQHEFLQLEAGSVVNLPHLVPTIKGFILFIPYALDMAFLRPHLSEVKNLSYMPAVAEIVLLFLLVIVFIFSAKKIALSSFNCFLLFFAVSVMLICGYTIPFSGAIVRYRSCVLPLIITPLLCLINFNVLKFNFFNMFNLK